MIILNNKNYRYWARCFWELLKNIKGSNFFNYSIIAVIVLFACGYTSPSYRNAMKVYFGTIYSCQS